jgi:hypothetical protein
LAFDANRRRGVQLLAEPGHQPQGDLLLLCELLDQPGPRPVVPGMQSMPPWRPPPAVECGQQRAGLVRFRPTAADDGAKPRSSSGVRLRLR